MESKAAPANCNIEIEVSDLWDGNGLGDQVRSQLTDYKNSIHSTLEESKNYTKHRNVLSIVINEERTAGSLIAKDEIIDISYSFDLKVEHYAFVPALNSNSNQPEVVYSRLEDFGASFQGLMVSLTKKNGETVEINGGHNLLNLGSKVVKSLSSKGHNGIVDSINYQADENAEKAVRGSMNQLIKELSIDCKLQCIDGALVCRT